MNEMDLSDFQPNDDLSRASTMPARWYLELAFLQLEKEKIFWKSWQAVGRLESVARPGDYFACDIFGEPVVVTHGLDGKLRAFSNVCRHRAGPVATGKGNRKSLQCKYHGWTYDLEGRLLTQPEFEGVNDWNKNEVCLPPFQVDRWGPFVFVNLNPNAPPLRDYWGAIPAEVDRAGFRVETMRFVERRDYIVSCNWKVYIENYLEGYHIPIAHPGLYRELEYDQYKVETFRYYATQFAPIRAAKEGQTHDRRYVRGEGEEKALYYWIFPNFMINIYPDNLQSNVVLPLDHERTLVIFEWYFSETGTPEGWESLQQSIGFSDEIQKEDMAICESVQTGLRSRLYNQGRYSVKRENGVHHFHLLVHEFLSAQ